MSENQEPMTLEDWAGAQNLALTLVFTDIVFVKVIGDSLMLAFRTSSEADFTQTQHHPQARSTLAPLSHAKSA